MGLDKKLWDPSRPDSLSSKLRERRWVRLTERFPDLDQMRVLDIGGTVDSWRLSPKRPLQLVLLNIFDQPEDGERVLALTGDACEPPASLVGERFDLVYSNSVIEHVGGHWRRERFAQTVHEAADCHWIQTPYRYFPIEPHWLFPFFQHLPLTAKGMVTARWPAGSNGWVRSVDQGISLSLDVELIDITTMRRYFPDSAIVREKFAGLTKSIVAVR